jgi:DNA-binding PadR family transcriptional regulator
VATDSVAHVLDVAILGLLQEGDLHGYELKKRLTELVGPWSSVSFGSLYPALSRLERRGLVATVSDDAPPVAPPMSGSLGAELAAFRRERPARRATSGRRARKIYTLTDAGRDDLTRQLADPSGDERSFAVRVAFCRLLPPSTRLEMFERRRADIQARLAGRHDADPRADLYRRSLLEFQDDRLRRELAWIDELIESVEPDLRPAQAPAAGSVSPGGSPS